MSFQHMIAAAGLVCLIGCSAHHTGTQSASKSASSTLGLATKVPRLKPRPRKAQSISKSKRLGPQGLAKQWEPCPKLRRSGHPKVYLLGSSTMGGLLGSMIRRELRRWGVRALLFGKASSGLARPDFFSWPKKIKQLVKRSNPDVFIVALGTNDFQVMRIFTRKRRWLRPSHPEWHPRYAKRVDELLHLMSGPDRRRTVIYIGPNVFHRSRSRRMAPRLTRLIRERIEAFDGPAYYVDAVTPLMTSRGRVAKRVRHPKTKRWMKVFGGDEIHLNSKGCRWIMAEPVYKILRPCFKAGRRGPLPRRDAGRETRVPRLDITQHQTHSEH